MWWHCRITWVIIPIGIVCPPPVYSSGIPFCEEKERKNCSYGSCACFGPHSLWDEPLNVEPKSVVNIDIFRNTICGGAIKGVVSRRNSENSAKENRVARQHRRQMQKLGYVWEERMHCGEEHLNKVCSLVCCEDTIFTYIDDRVQIQGSSRPYFSFGLSWRHRQTLRLILRSTEIRWPLGTCAIDGCTWGIACRSWRRNGGWFTHRWSHMTVGQGCFSMKILSVCTFFRSNRQHNHRTTIRLAKKPGSLTQDGKRRRFL